MELIEWTKIIQTVIIAIIGAILLYKLIPKIGKIKGKIVGQEFEVDNKEYTNQFSAEQDDYVNEEEKRISAEFEQSFKFSTKLQLTSYLENEVKKEGFRFRIGTIKENDIFFKIELKAYLVVSSLESQPDKTSGWGRTWRDIPLGREFLPELTGYWTISHYFSKESPFIFEKNSKETSEIKIYIYAYGYDKNGKRVFGSQEYFWNNKDTVFGQFQLRKLGQDRLTDEEFDYIIPKEDIKNNWPRMK